MSIIIGYTNRGHARLAANWLVSLKRLGIDDRVRLYCTNDDAFEVMRVFCDRLSIRSHVEVFSLKTGGFFEVEASSVNWGTKEFTCMMLARLDLFTMLCKQDPFVPFLHTDVDCAFVRDSFDYLDKFCIKEDLYIQSNRADFIYPNTKYTEFCCGIQYYRADRADLLYRASLWLARKLLDLEKAKPGSIYVDDEHAMNQSMYEMGYNPGVLPIDKFPTGRNPWNLNPIAVHANWVVGLGMKEYKLRKGGYWYVDDKMLKDFGL